MKKTLLLSTILLGCSAPVTSVVSPSTTEVVYTTSSTTSTLPLLQPSTTVLGRSTLPISTTTTTTEPAPVWRKTIVAVGDIVCSENSSAECVHEETALLAQSFEPDAVLALGDLQYENGSLSAFNTMYDPSWGVMRNITYPVVGNHEYYSNGEGLKEYFNLDSFYYSFDIGEWHIIALDSEKMTTEQDEWLAADLASTDAECIISYWHSPRWSSGAHGSYTAIQRLWEPISEAGGDLVLSGHDHHYERFLPVDGMTQFVVGTGGKSLRGVGSLENDSAFTYNASQGVLVVDLYEGFYHWFFVSTDYAIVDFGHEVC